MDHGIQPISKTPRTSKGKTAAVNLGPHTFKTPDSSFETNIVALNGTPTITIVDGDGHTYYQPLRRQSTQIGVLVTTTDLHLRKGCRGDSTLKQWSLHICNTSSS